MEVLLSILSSGGFGEIIHINGAMETHPLLLQIFPQVATVL